MSRDLSIIGLIGPCLVVGLPASTGAQQTLSESPDPSSQSDLSLQAAPQYSIGPGDVLTISVWKEQDLSQDLSGDVTVRLDGQIAMPLVGKIMASGQSPGQLSHELGDKLTRFIDAPRVTVAVSQANSAHFFVVGQVNGSGANPLTGRLTVLQALAMAEGFTTFAKRDKILVIREVAGKQKFIGVDDKDIEAGESLQKNVVAAARRHSRRAVKGLA